VNTLAQYQTLDVDAILSGVVDWLLKESPILGVLPMKPIRGNSYLYNINLSLPSPNWVQVGDTLSESTGTWEQRSTNIYTLIDTGYTDKTQIILNATQDPELVAIEQSAQAMAQAWERAFIVGRTSVDSNAKEYKGILRILAEFESATTTDLNGAVAGGGGNNSQVLAAGATNGATSMALLHELVDMIKPGKPDLLLMSKLSRRRVNALQQAAGNAGMLMGQSELFGKTMDMFDGIPIMVSDYFLDNFPDNSSSVLDIATYDYDAVRASGTNLDNSLIFAMKFGERSVQGLHAGDMTHERETFIENRNAIANRFTWNTGLMCASKFSLAVLTGLVS